MRTGKQMWEHVESLRDAVVAAVRGASDDELRHALGYGADRIGSSAAEIRVLVKREMRRRGAEIPKVIA